MFERKVYNQLLEWKNTDILKPLMIIGARQIGKTYSVLEFGKKEYKNTVYFNTQNYKELIELKSELFNICLCFVKTIISKIRNSTL